MNEFSSVAFAVLVSIFGTPFVYWLLRKIAPATDNTSGDLSVKQQRLNKLIYAGAFLLIFVGGLIPFYIEGSGELKPSLRNGVLVISFALAFPVGFVFIAASALGDWGAQKYFVQMTRENKINPRFAQLASLFMLILCGSLIAMFI